MKYGCGSLAAFVRHRVTRMMILLCLRGKDKLRVLMLLFALALLPAIPNHMDTLERGPASFMSYKLHNWGTQYNDGKTCTCLHVFQKTFAGPEQFVEEDSKTNFAGPEQFVEEDNRTKLMEQPVHLANAVLHFIPTTLRNEMDSGILCNMHTWCGSS